MFIANCVHGRADDAWLAFIVDYHVLGLEIDVDDAVGDGLAQPLRIGDVVCRRLEMVLGVALGDILKQEATLVVDVVRETKHAEEAQARTRHSHSPDSSWICTRW